MGALKRISLAQAVQKIDYIDGCGEHQTPIEEHIRPVIVALMAHGFPTAASCEGHIIGTLYPWVLFQQPLQDTTKEGFLECLGIIRGQAEVLSSLLREFYESRAADTTSDRLLIVTDNDYDLTSSDEAIVKRALAESLYWQRSAGFPACVGYSLHCKGAETLDLMPREALRTHTSEILRNRQHDMFDFAQFLVSKL